jgi:ABC-2 type transport system ATP-binding protein
MPQAEEICRHVIMIHKGRKVLDQTLTEIRSQYDPRRIEFNPLDPNADVSSIAQLPGVEQVDRDNTGYSIRLADGTDPAEAMRRIIHTETPARLELARPRLEDIFISLVSDSAGTAEDRQKLKADLVNADSEGAGL